MYIFYCRKQNYCLPELTKMKMESWMKMRLQKSTKSFWSCTQDLEEIDYISMVSLYNMYSWFGRNIIYFWGRRSRDRGSWIYNYLCNQCLSPLTLRVGIPLRRGVLNTTLCDQVCPWLTVGRWFSPGTRIWFGPVNCSFQFKSCKCIFKYINCMQRFTQYSFCNEQ